MSYRHYGMMRRKVESIPPPQFTVLIVIAIVFLILAVPLIVSLTNGGK
jgi:hypothetical protein